MFFWSPNKKGGEGKCHWIPMRKQPTDTSKTARARRQQQKKKKAVAKWKLRRKKSVARSGSARRTTHQRPKPANAKAAEASAARRACDVHSTFLTFPDHLLENVGAEFKINGYPSPPRHVGKNLCRLFQCWHRQRAAVKFPFAPEPIIPPLNYYVTAGKLTLRNDPKNQTRKYDDFDIQLKKLIKRGTNASVFGCEWTPKNHGEAGNGVPLTYDLAAKISGAQDREDVREALIQIAIVCLLRTKYPQKYPPEMAHVPCIRMLRSFRALELRTSRMNFLNVTVMDRLQGTLGELIDAKIPPKHLSAREAKIQDKKLCVLIEDAVYQVARLLVVLQRELGFEHRDMHTGNIMYTETTDRTGKTSYEYYVMDFGMSAIFEYPHIQRFLPFFPRGVPGKHAVLQWDAAEFQNTWQVPMTLTSWRRGTDMARLLISIHRHLETRRPNAEPKWMASIVDSLESAFDSMASTLKRRMMCPDYMTYAYSGKFSKGVFQACTPSCIMRKIKGHRAPTAVPANSRARPQNRHPTESKEQGGGKRKSKEKGGGRKVKKKPSPRKRRGHWPGPAGSPVDIGLSPLAKQSPSWEAAGTPVGSNDLSPFATRSSPKPPSWPPPSPRDTRTHATFHDPYSNFSAMMNETPTVIKNPYPEYPG